MMSMVGHLRRLSNRRPVWSFRTVEISFVAGQSDTSATAPIDRRRQRVPHSMFHDSLYRLERNQKTCLTILGFLFLIASAGWLAAELCEWWFPMEPVVVFLGGTATLMATFWPWKPGYADRRLQGRNSVDYMRNDHLFTIGRGAMTFTLRFSKASDETIYVLRDPPDIERLALASDAGRISDIRDASALDFSNRIAATKEGEIVVLQNVHGNYAAVHVHDVRDADRDDDRNEVTFSYVINPSGGTNFS